MNALQFVKENGEIKWIGKSLEYNLSILPNGTYQLKIEKARKQRTVSQNALMWMWFNCLAAPTGSSPEDVYDHYRNLFLRRIITYKGKEEYVIGRASELDTKGMTEFLNKIQADAATDGIILPLPSDRFFEEFAAQYKY